MYSPLNTWRFKTAVPSKQTLSSNKVIFYSDSEIQERDKVTVGTMTIMIKK